MTLSGTPGGAVVRDLATDERTSVEPGEGGTFALPCSSVPALLEVTWEDSGVKVSAQADVVAVRYCELSDILAYRADQYELKASEGDLFAARARAEQVIESSCGRALQPVMRLGFVDRDCPAKTRGMVAGEDGYDSCLIRVATARSSSGDEVELREVGSGPYVDLTHVGFGDAARVAYVTGLAHVPPEARGAVCSLAAWYLAPRTAPENATSTSTDVGVMSFVIAGVSGAETSLPDVNALISRFGLSNPKVG